MAISTYSELKTAVAAWLDRTDLDDYMDDFIRLGEVYLMHGGGSCEPLRVRDMETTVSLTRFVTNPDGADSGGDSVGDFGGPIVIVAPEYADYYELPSDFLSAKSITALTSPRRPLEFITPSGADKLYQDRLSGSPNHYMVVGNILTALPYTSSEIELVYYKSLEGLSATNDSNWLLAKNPDLYLRVVQMQAAEFIKDQQQAGIMMGLVDKYVSQLNDAEAFDDYRNVGLNLSGVVV